MDKRHMLHVTLYCSAISPCGNYLAVGNNFGFISLFNIANTLSPNASETSKKPSCIFKAHQGPIHSLQSTSNYLISAGCGPIVGWKWADIINHEPLQCWSLSKTVENGEFIARSNTWESYNCMSFNAKDNVLFTGGDDNNVLMWDLKSSTCVETFIGHSNYIHDIDLASGNLFSASEDGRVKMWDTRTVSCFNTLEPFKSTQLSRPHLGKWIASLAADTNGQWIACGGGPRTSLWHVRSSNMITTLDDMKPNAQSEFTPHTIQFYNDEIIAGGNRPFVHRWNVNGTNKAAIPCSIKNIFSISFKPCQQKADKEMPMIITGTSPTIDLFTNLGYLRTSLSVA